MFNKIKHLKHKKDEKSNFCITDQLSDNIIPGE